MLSAIGRAAVRRVVAGGAQSKHQALRSLSHLQRVDATQNASNSSSRSQFSLPIRRSYVTATKAAPKAKATVGSTKAKTKAKKAAPKKAVKKKVVKKKVAKKPKKVKVKKVLTEAQKERLALRKSKAQVKDLKALALSPPPTQPPSAFIVLSTEYAKNAVSAGKFEFSSTIKEASAKYKSLSPAELESYNHKANQLHAEREIAFKKWLESHTPEQIRIANNARKQLKSKDKSSRSSKWALIKDERIPKKAKNAYMVYMEEKHASGDMKGISFLEAGKLIAKEWSDLTASERKPYEDTANSDAQRYAQEYQTVFQKPPPLKKTVA